MEKQPKSSFSGSLGFILAAAGSAVGVGNIWRFPYLAAKNGGGLFILVYLALVLTFGFSLLSTDIAIGRRTKQSATRAFASVRPKWGFLGKLTFLVPLIIITYYCVIGGWISKYIAVYLSGEGAAAAGSSYFTDFISAPVAPLVFMLAFLGITAFIVFCGVEKGIERFSKIIMPGLFLMIIGISVFALTLSHTDESGATRTGLEGLKVYLIPNFEGLTFTRFLSILVDAMSQLFFSLSVAMGIMITFGSYVKDDVNLGKSVTTIEFFDTLVAVLSGVMIIPAVYVFQGLEGMQSGAKLMFISLPKVFESMGAVGGVVGGVFFIMAAFAALTSSVSIMETLVASLMEMFGISRKKASLAITIFAAVGSVVVCLGYNVFYFELTLPNGTVAQILDIMDYISNSLIMPVVSLLTCVFVGWVMTPKWITDEMERSGHHFGRKRLYTAMIKYITPVLMVILLLQSVGLFRLLGGN